MNLTLLSVLLLFNTMSTKTPNFYPTYIAAKEASKNYKKDLLIFFSKKSCATCDAAWTNFEKDQLATKIFISTLVDMQDFDGAVIMDKYGLTDAPSWVVLDSEGKVKQTWKGEWKNPFVRPDETTQAASAKPESAVETAPALKTLQSTPASTPPAEKPVSPSTPPVQAEKAVATPPPAAVIAPKTDVAVTGYVLQAGYFGSEANALKLVSDLKAKGYDHYTTKTTVQNGSTFYRVISGTYPSEAEANKEVTALSTSGIKASIKKMNEL